MKYYQNPLKIPDCTSGALPDPFLLRHLGVYYCYTTGTDQVHVLRSHNLIEFEYLGAALDSQTDREFWAPCVVYRNGLFHMFYSSRQKGSDDPHQQRMKLAVADRPEGPFAYVATLSDSFCIDADVRYTAPGWEMYYATNDFCGNDLLRPGTSVALGRMDNASGSIVNSENTIAPDCDREIFARNRFGDGRDWHTVEAPCYLRRRGREYLMYSGSAYTGSTYFVDYCLRNRDGSWCKRSDGTGDALLQSDGTLYGTGHNSVVAGLNGLDIYTAFHGMDHVPVDGEADCRLICVSRLLALGSVLRLDDKPSAVRPVPTPPGKFYFCQSADPSLEEDWCSVTGWKENDGWLSNMSDTAFSFLRSRCLYTDCFFTLSLKADSYKTGGTFGFYISYISKDDYARILIHPGERILKLERASEEGKKTAEFHLADTDFFSWQNLTVEKTGTIASVSLNDRFIGQVDTNGDASTVAFFGSDCVGCFCAFSVTGHYLLCAENMEGASERISGGNLTQDGNMLICRDDSFRIGNPFFDSFEAEVCLHIRSPQHFFELRFSQTGENFCMRFSQGDLMVRHGDETWHLPMLSDELAVLLVVSKGKLWIHSPFNSIVLQECPRGDMLCLASGCVAIEYISLTEHSSKSEPPA